MKKILITGGAGFAGSHLVQRCISDGNQIGVVDNLSFGNIKYLPIKDSNFIFWKVDICDKESLKKIFREFKPDMVIHLAALHFIPYCNRHPLETMQVNILGTRNILKCCEAVKPDVFFFSSSAAIYPIRNGANREDSNIGPIDIYGITKFCGENMVELFSRKMETRTIVGRFFNIYGPNETNPHLIPEIVKQLKSGKREIELGNLSPMRDFIHVRDVADAIYMLIEKFDEKYGVLNIGSGSEYSVKEIVGYFEEILSEVITITKCSSKTRKVERAHLLADINKIQEVAGWTSKTDMLEGLKELVL